MPLTAKKRTDAVVPNSRTQASNGRNVIDEVLVPLLRVERSAVPSETKPRRVRNPTPAKTRGRER